MVFHPANHECRTFPLFENSRLIREQGGLMFFRNQWFAMFGAIHEMNQILNERLGHGSRLFVPPFQGLSSFLFADPGRRPGLVCCSPFGARK